MADGTITFSTDLDNKELEKKLQSTQKRVERLEDSIAQKKAERLPLVDQAKQLQNELDASITKLYRMESAADGVFSPDQISEQRAQMKTLESEWKSVQSRVDRYDTAINNTTINLDRQKEKAGGIQQELVNASKGGTSMGTAVESAQKSMQRFKMRLREVIRSALIFTVITQSLAKLRDWIGKITSTNSEASAAIAQLKGALLTLAQPLVDIVIPVFTFFVRVLTAVVSALAQVFAMLTGKSISSTKQSAKALNAETGAISDAGDAAEKAKKQLTGFDEINQIGGNDSSGSGGGVSTGGSTAPNFDFDTDLSEGQLKNILGLVEMVGAALLLWALPKGMTKNFKTFAGLLLLIDGTVGFIKDMMDAWVNGVNTENLNGMLIRTLEIVGGLYLAFGSTAAAIGLLVAGVALIVTGIQDAMEVGWNAQNLLMVISGILFAGIGIAALTGSWIPLLIAGIAALLLFIAVNFGEGEKLLGGLKTILQGFKDFFVGIFTGDIQKAIGGIGEVFSGLKTVFFSVVDALENMFNSFLDWIDDKTHGKLHGIIEYYRALLGNVFQWTKDNIGTVIDTVQHVLTGLITFISGVFTGNWDDAWQGVKDIFGGIWDGITGLLDNAINAVIREVNWMIRQLNKISFDAPNWVPVVGGKHFGIDIQEIPYLAQGAVIPPNREFMAVLGDQHHGTNVEAPLETIQQAVAITMQPLMDAMMAFAKSGGGNIALTVNLDGRVVYENVVQRNNAIVRSTGESPLLT